MKSRLLILLCLSFNLCWSQETKFSYSGPGDSALTSKVHPSYDLFTLHKQSFKPKIGGIDFLPDGRMLICTWDSLGAVYEVNNLSTNDTNKITYKRIAAGLCEPLGIKVVGSKIYVLQRPELTELIDLDRDGIIDEYKTICDSYGFSGNYHEYSFGPIYKHPHFYATLSTPRRTRKPSHLDRGSAIQIDTNGNFKILARGFRTPNGIGFGIDSLIYINDNQGEWLPASKMLILKEGAFYGYRGVDFMGTIDYETEPAVILMPHYEAGNSPSQMLIMQDGPYKGQMIHGDVTHGGIKRVYLEKIDSVYQGCIFNFTQGLEGGVNRIAWGPDGGLYVGAIGSTGNWGQERKHKYGLQKLKFNGKSAFEMLKIKIQPMGFDIEFTEPFNATQINSGIFSLSQWKYLPTEKYGGPKIDQTDLKVVKVEILNQKTVRLYVNNIKEGHVVYFKIKDPLKSKSGKSLWITESWYTINKIPETKKGSLTGTPKTEQVYKTPNKPNKASNNLTPKSEQGLNGIKLLENSGCLQCHQINQRIIGPSFKEVSTKYKGKANSKDKLMSKVKNGGSGVWGDEAMPPQSHLSAEKISKLIAYILSL